MLPPLAMFGAAFLLLPDVRAVAVPAPVPDASASATVPGASLVAAQVVATPTISGTARTCSVDTVTAMTTTSILTLASTTIPVYTISLQPTLGCTCNDGWMAALGTSTGTDGLATVTCEFGDDENPAVATQNPAVTTAGTTAQGQGVATTISAPAACTSGVVPNDNTASCWGDMDLDTYVNDWWNDNKASCDNTVTHPADGDSTASFANCWYKLMVANESPTNCDVLNTGTSCAKPSWPDFIGDNFEANFWVTWSIYNTNTWWTSMNTAVIAAGSNVDSVVGKVVTTLNPPKPAETPDWVYILYALAFATSLWAEGSETFKAIVRTVPQTAALAPKVYPQGKVEGTVSEWADVQHEINQFIRKWADSIGDAVPLVANDVSAFTSMAGAGQFTGGTYDLSGLTDSTNLLLGTMMTSIAMVATEYIITRTAGQSIAEIQSSSDLYWDTECGGGYDSHGICGAFYYDGSDTYALTSQQKWQTDTTDLMQTLFAGDTPVADPKLLFTGSLACSTSNDNKNGGTEPSLDSADPNTFNCVASNRVCTWNWDLENEAYVHSDPFVPNCGPDDLPSIYSFHCGGANTGMCVPFAYFGPEMETSSKSKVCHTDCGGGEVS